MPTLHVLLTKRELDRERLSGKIVVVLDILFATTSIVAALAHGAKEVVPLRDGAAARAEANKREASSYLLSGELNAETLPGFCHPTPLALMREDLSRRSLLYCTTNGTVALHQSNAAKAVYAGALINGSAVVEHILRAHESETVLIACAGSADHFNLEDFYGAGHLVSLLLRHAGAHYEPTDAARAARLLYERTDAWETLAEARVGRMMRSRHLEDEIRFAAQKDCFAVVPQLVDGALRPVPQE